MNNQQLLKSPHKRCIKEDQIVASSTLWNHFHVSHSPCCLKAIQISDSNGNFPGIWWLGIINSDGGWGFELSERNTKTGTSWNAVSGWDKSLTWIWDLLYACIAAEFWSSYMQMQPIKVQQKEPKTAIRQDAAKMWGSVPNWAEVVIRRNKLKWDSCCQQNIREM